MARVQSPIFSEILAFTTVSQPSPDYKHKFDRYTFAAQSRVQVVMFVLAIIMITIVLAIMVITIVLAIKGITVVLAIKVITIVGCI